MVVEYKSKSLFDVIAWCLLCSSTVTIFLFVCQCDVVLYCPLRWWLSPAFTRMKNAVLRTVADAVIFVLAPVDAWLFFTGTADDHIAPAAFTPFQHLKHSSLRYSNVSAFYFLPFPTGLSSKRLKKSELLDDLQRSSGNGTAAGPGENSGEDE